jgi:predicted anti-sigma-YlaC factor YlaD
MNCADVRARLPALLYGDLSADEAGRVRDHLAGCPSCREEQAAFAGVRRLLGAVPAPAGTVDLPRLYRDAAEQHRRRLRRWRRIALASLAAAAAVVLAVLLSRLEVRLDGNQLVLRWGAAPPESPVPAPPPQPREPPVAVAPPAPATEVEEHLRLLSEAVRALSDDADQRDERRQQEVARLRAQVLALQQQMIELRLATEKDVAALYAAQFPPKQKGASP